MSDDGPDLFKNFTWLTAIGIILTLLGTTTQNLALGLMKVLHNKNVVKPKEQQRPYWKQCRWYLTLSLLLSGVFMDLASLSFLPASLAMPIGGTGLAVNGIFSAKFLGERFTKFDIIGTIAIVAGCWVAILFSNKPPASELWTAPRLLQSLIPNQLSGIYVIVLLVLCVVMFIITRKIRNNALLGCLLPGCVAGFVNLGGKGIAEMIRATVSGQNQFVEWFLYIWVAFTVAAILTQNHFLQAAMERFDNAIVGPLYFICLCLFAIIGGVCFYSEWVASLWWQNFLFVVGVLMIFSGVILIAKSHLRPGTHFRTFMMGDKKQEHEMQQKTAEGAAEEGEAHEVAQAAETQPEGTPTTTQSSSTGPADADADADADNAGAPPMPADADAGAGVGPGADPKAAALPSPVIADFAVLASPALPPPDPCPQTRSTQQAAPGEGTCEGDGEEGAIESISLASPASPSLRPRESPGGSEPCDPLLVGHKPALSDSARAEDKDKVRPVVVMEYPLPSPSDSDSGAQGGPPHTPTEAFV